MTFAGDLLEDIAKSTRQGWQDLLGVTDLLLDGPYIRDLTDTSRPWLGSTNQRYHFLTLRYRHLEAELGDIPNRLEVRLQPDGKVFINGLASSELLDDTISGVAKRPAKP
jgi:anaerobic ribonucleoside-triphosphate reductase activating protein